VRLAQHDDMVHGAGLRPRTCFSVINSASPSGVRRLVFDCAAVARRMAAAFSCRERSGPI
jgi:hypothetical protein